MTPTISADPSYKQSDIIAKVIVKLVALMVAMPAIIFIPARRADWVMAWIHLGLFMIAATTNTLLMIRNDPELRKERNQIRHNAKTWDQVLTRLIAVGPMVMLIVAGFDKRFGWCPQIPFAIQISAVIMAIGGYILSGWAMISNAFYSPVVRIQKEREHRVISEGPYRIIRHPGYTGGIIAFLATPLILSSFWTFIPAVLTITTVIVRTALEDHTLKNELEGYTEYSHHVDYRLIPGIW
jgi:protein-S-isoprenylcysteine O-methyltransferase Ste14